LGRRSWPCWFQRCPVSLFQFASSGLYDPYFAIGLTAYFTLGAIVVVLCRSERNVRTALQQGIAERKKALAALEREQALLQHTIEIQDHERQLIAYEIHDGVLQYATGALMQLEALHEHLASDVDAKRIQAVTEILRKTVAEGRRLINGIRPPVLDHCGIVAAVEQLIDDEERAHVAVEFVKDDSLGKMHPPIEEALYRIAQEALTNIRKHSDGKKVLVELGRQGDRVHLHIRDWGVGFVSTNGRKSVHGISCMTERARIAGSQCTVASTRGAGTEVTADLPYVQRNGSPAPR
jgi:signal transduction histidine kinase